ncbi:MauE/DoxX family redox-associated membrane protein [Spongisporangium articulatum]|uniref:MauE/DoxX family redox-associated membrane protein n=1 Tax=Spongisporangium articulatum TaxID=3362603 RepID=A0ABW8ARB1_9ACTN
MRRWADSPWVGTLARLVVGGVFAVSGWTKITDLDATIRSVRNYRLLPEAFVPAFGTALPAVELALAFLLLAGLLVRVAAPVTALMSVMFIVGVSSAWARGLQIECGCFGNSGPSANPVPGYVRELVLNTVIVLACAWLVRRPMTRLSLDGALGLNVPLDELDDDELPDDEPTPRKTTTR